MDLDRISLGLIPGWELVHAHGGADLVDISDAPIDVWTGGGLYTGFPDGDDEAMEIFSDDTEDNPAGTGMGNMRLIGLDTDGLEQEEDIALDGTTPVVTQQTWTRCHTAHSLLVGSGGGNAGTITLRHVTTTANVFGTMRPDLNRTHNACYTVPTDRRAIIKSSFAVLRRDGGAFDREASMDIRYRVPGCAFRRVMPFGMSISSNWSRNAPGGIFLPGGTDVAMCCDGLSRDASNVSGGFDVLVMDPEAVN